MKAKMMMQSEAGIDPVVYRVLDSESVLLDICVHGVECIYTNIIYFEVKLQ